MAENKLRKSGGKRQITLNLIEIIFISLSDNSKTQMKALTATKEYLALPT